jgi:hypothetical protein
VSGFRILTTRKRIIVALVHTVAFLALAIALSRTLVRPLRTASAAGAWALAGVYLAVTVALLVLLGFAGPAERLYFALCASSAGFGLARQILGDPRMHSAIYLRVALLSCAVISASSMLRRHVRPVASVPDRPSSLGQRSY